MDLIVTSAPQEISFYPDDELAEIAQNVRTILTTTKFSVPLDRDFGTDSSIIDEPIPISKAKYTANVVEAIEKYEPRVKVTEVTFEEDQLIGKLIVKVAIRVV